MQRAESDTMSVLINRGAQYSTAESLCLLKRFDSKPIPQDDGGVEVPQLEHIEGLTYHYSQKDQVIEEIRQASRPQLQLQPLFFNQIAKCNYTLLPNSTAEPNSEGPELKSSDPKQFVAEEEKYIYAPPRKYLLYHQKLVTPKEFSLCKGSPRDCLKFEGRFEGGNCYQVSQLAKENNFEIYVNPDQPTPFHTGFFNFKVQNITKNTKYQFKIMNLGKLMQPIQPIAYIDGKYMPIGTQVACYRSNEMQKTEFWYAQIPDDFVNMEQIKESDEYLNLVKDFKTMQKKKGLKKKQIEKKLYRLETNNNCYHYVFQFSFDFDVPLCQISQYIPYTLTHLLTRCEKLNQMVIKPITIEVKQLCRSYFGNPVPVIKIYQGNDIKKDIILILSRVAPNDSLSQFISDGFIDELTGKMDYIYTDKLKLLNEGELEYQKLYQEYQKHKDTRLQVISQYVFFIVPSFSVDASITGSTRVNNFNQNFNRLFGTISTYKNPQLNFILQLQSFAEMTKVNIKYCLDLKSAKVQKMIFDCNLLNKFTDIKLKIYELLGKNLIIPVLKNDVRIFDDVRMGDSLQKVEPIFDDTKDKKPIFKKFLQQLKEYLKSKKAFDEFAEFGVFSQNELFDFANTTFTEPIEEKKNTARCYFQSIGTKSYTVRCPRTYSSQKLRECGRECANFIMYRDIKKGLIMEEEIERIQTLYLEWVESALLQQFSSGKFKILDPQKFSQAQLDKIPEKLKLFSTMDDVERYDAILELNDKIKVRQALGVNLLAKNVSDSDDSECDTEAGSGMPAKINADDKLKLQEKVQGIKDIFQKAYPEPVRVKSGKKRSKSAKKDKVKK
ncbi:Peptidase_M14 like family protein [Hexamita inflata]|uniref:Peptidase M14 like family protein n=2 Tax=Hexamita inflata TaxID=28002 RepID=A0AA86U188_9EUKA|nr:Peptidase M14 like family protein [Hexamita inflata]